jgi:hypothetical protein
MKSQDYKSYSYSSFHGVGITARSGFIDFYGVFCVIFFLFFSFFPFLECNLTLGNLFFYNSNNISFIDIYVFDYLLIQFLVPSYLLRYLLYVTLNSL